MADANDHTRSKLQSPGTAKEYWHIDQSQGAIFTLPGTIENGRLVTALGSTGCRTCVCVFVELNQTTCFAAHISAIDHAADVAAGDGKTATAEQRAQDNRARIVPDAAKAQQLIEIVVKSLSSIPYFSSQVVGGKFKGKVEQASVLCPMKIWGGERATGSFIIQALEQFFGVTVECRLGHGFIAAPGDGRWSLQVLGWKDRYPGPSKDDTEFYDAKRHEETTEKYGLTRMNPCEEPKLGGKWAFAFTKDGSWVQFSDRD